MNAATDLDAVIEEYHASLEAFMRGDHEPAKKLFSREPDVTLGNPFGPFARGWEDVVETMARAAGNYRDGGATGFDRVAEYTAPGLVCLVEVERLRSKVGGRPDVVPLALRVTTIFRREEGGWRIAHRHADPISTPQPAESVIKQ